MSAWTAASLALIVSMAPCGYLVFSPRPNEDRLVGLELATLLETLALLTLAEATGNPNLFDCALALGLLSFGSGLVFVHFLERWL